MSKSSWARFRGCTATHRLAIVASSLLAIVLLVACSEEDPVSPPGGGGDPTNPGFITGHVFLTGDPEHTNQIIIEFFESNTGTKVDSTIPDDEGLFLSGELLGGSYDVFASTALPGFGVASENNVVVVEGQTTNINYIDVPDTSRVQITNLSPSPYTAIVPRRPVIAGEFLSTGSGIKETTFSLVVNGEQVFQQADLTIAEDLLSGSFTYEPLVNLRPGLIEVEVHISNRAGNTTIRQWRFSVLDGVQRRVPGEYQTIQLAYWAANDGDTLMVGPGTHTVDNLKIEKELVIAAEAFLAGGTTAQTVLLPGGSGRHFRIGRNVDEATIMKGFLFRDANVSGRDSNGGAIQCFTCGMTVESCDFEDNRVPEGRGGAISMLNGGDMHISNCRFTGNDARRGGAIAVFDRSQPIVEYCQFVGNEATADGGDGGLGGAIYMLASHLRVEHSTFYNNLAGNAGGAIMSDASVYIGDSQIDSILNLYVMNNAESGVIHLHNNSRMNTSCDGFQRISGDLFAGTGMMGIPDRQTIIDIATDPGFCDAAGGNLHLRADSPFLHPECDPPGALPVNCGGWW